MIHFKRGILRSFVPGLGVHGRQAFEAEVAWLPVPGMEHIGHCESLNISRSVCFKDRIQQALRPLHGIETSDYNQQVDH